MNTPQAPQKWKAIIDRGYSFVMEDRPALPGECMPHVIARELSPEHAQLFAAAPDLLAACKLFVEWCNTPDQVVWPEVIEAIHDAVEKAELKPALA